MPDTTDSTNANHERWMQVALLEAHKASEIYQEVPVGAVIVSNNQIIAQAHNFSITEKNPTAHAEILVLKKAGNYLNNYRLTGCDLYVTLEPCLMCVGAMVHARINHCYFSAHDPKTGAASSCDHSFEKPYHNHKVGYTGGILENQSRLLLKNFFKTRR